MVFECENCHHKLVNEFCPKCGQRMLVACDECVARKKRVDELESRFLGREARYSSTLQSLREEYQENVDKLRKEYDDTIAQQRESLDDNAGELKRLREVERSVLKRQDEWQRDAWASVAKALEIELPLGYVIDEASVLRQLKIERAAAVVLRAQLGTVRAECHSQIEDFAKEREALIQKMDGHIAKLNGHAAAKIEAPKSEV